jgi:hypothetical protein
MRHYRLSNAEAAGNGGFTDAIEVTFADLTETAANTAQTLAILSVPAGATVLDAQYTLVDEFEDASDNAFNVTSITVGDGGSTARFIPSKELNVNGTEVDYWATSNATSTIPYMYTEADTIDVVFTSMAAKALNDLDVGSVTFKLRIARP